MVIKTSKSPQTADDRFALPRKRENHLSVELWPIDRPKPYARNPRKISPQAIAKVAASIKSFGFRQPVVVDRKGVIVVGHARLMAARDLGLTEVPRCTLPAI